MIVQFVEGCLEFGPSVAQLGCDFAADGGDRIFRRLGHVHGGGLHAGAAIDCG